MSHEKKLVRKRFRTSCLDRDKHCCRFCGKVPDNGDEGLDVHHINDRHHMPDGGYVLANGISLCSDCHLAAEQYHISGGKTWTEGMHPDDLYRMIDSAT